MVVLVLKPTTAIDTLVNQILFSRNVTQADRSSLQAALLNHSLSPDEQILVDRVLYGVRHGLLRAED